MLGLRSPRIVQNTAALAGRSVPIWNAGRILDLNSDSLGLSNNAAVGSWPADIGSVTFSQATAGAKPLYKTSVLNGHSGVLFDAVDDGFTTGFSTGSPSAISIAIVGTTTHAASEGFIAADTSYLVSIGRSAQYFYYDNGYVSGPSTTVTAGSSHILLVQTSGAGSKAYLDGADITTDGTPTGIPATLYVGSNGSASFSGLVVDGTMYRIIVWNKVLSSGERAAFVSDMQAAYGL